jgi:hypothetical protein
MRKTKLKRTTWLVVFIVLICALLSAVVRST